MLHATDFVAQKARCLIAKTNSVTNVSPDCEPCIHGDGTLIAATLLTKESAMSRVSGAVNGSSFERPIIIVLINVSSCTGTSLTIFSNKLIKKQFDSKGWS